MFRTNLHPSPLGLALGVILVALWAGVWIGLLAGFGPQTQTRRPGQQPEAARLANSYKLARATAQWSSPETLFPALL
jgi:hypothetical protein